MVSNSGRVNYSELNENDIPMEILPESSGKGHMNGIEEPVSNGNEESSSGVGIQNSFQDGRQRGFHRWLSKLWNGPDSFEDNSPRPIRSLIWLEKLSYSYSHLSQQVRFLLLASYCCFWFGLCYTILVPYLTVPPQSQLDSSKSVITLSCGSSGLFWSGKNAACGTNAKSCPSFREDEDVVFRCPSLCDRGSWTYSLIPIGDQRIKHRGYFVGGGNNVTKKYDDAQLSDPYRADSFPCGAAIHAGAISPFFGGCARISYKSKDQQYFKSQQGRYNVDDSISFLSFFPSSFFFKKLTGSEETLEHFSNCNDPRLLILVTNIILGLPVVFFASPLALYWIINIVGFWTICLATDPPINVDPSEHEDYARLLSLGMERFLPTCFVLYVLWKISTKRTFTHYSTEDTIPSRMWIVILFYPFFWLGVLNNITFDRLPVDRLTINDLKEQPGALLAVSSIFGVILTCAVIQAYKIWCSGRFKKYLAIYSSFILGLFFLANLDGLTLRVHHYILALLLIPGCATRGKTAIVFQGILLGLFLSGASRWGYASIIETVMSLQRDDPLGKIQPPVFDKFDEKTGILSWQDHFPKSLTPKQKVQYDKYNRISLLINDVQAYKGKDEHQLNFKELLQSNKQLMESVEKALKHGLKEKDDIPIYLRLGRASSGSRYSDYTNAAILKWPSGKLSLPKPGIT